MLTLKQVLAALSKFRYPPDAQQLQVISASSAASNFVVAGPGTGKTTCLTLRVLKLILVDQIPPRGILATTFTVKAAEELRSRILGWGFRIIEELKKDGSLTKKQREYLEEVDINQVWTGTVDSLCEQLLRDFRAPGTQPPVLVDEFVSKTLMLREGLFNNRRFDNPDLDDYLLNMHSPKANRYGFHLGTKTSLLRNFCERRYQDQVAWNKYISGGKRSERPARDQVNEALASYEVELKNRQMVDFSMLENEVLERLVAGKLEEFTADLQVVLVDEYQDSNLLQERLYFNLAQACGGALTVVGDDDQSLYRFRGATVDLFRDFPARYQETFGKLPTTVFLTNNYRSTDEIRDFVNNYAVLDAGYQTVRVAGKPPLVRPTLNPGVPVLGMFRDTVEELAEDLARFVHDVFRGKGRRVAGKLIIADKKRGDVGDCALLCSSPQENAAGGRARLPLLLRHELGAATPFIQVFNPRGEDPAGIRIVQILGGLLAECLDLGGMIQANTPGVFREASGVLNDWRQIATDFVLDSSAPAGLQDYATKWADRDPGRAGYDWPRSISVIELLYGLVHFFPEFHDDPEGQVYLEVFTRQLTACEQIGKFKGRVVHNPADPGLGEASVKELIRDFLVPIATKVVLVDEELLESFPRDRLSILSIHQSKGLEFPLTIVDVGSDFKTRHAAHQFKRYPSEGGPPHRFENLLRPFAPGLAGTIARPQVDRAFDDLIRQYFVAFSRAQDVLLLVGLTKTAPGGNVENVATGWDRARNCAWDGNVPYEEI